MSWSASAAKVRESVYAREDADFYERSRVKRENRDRPRHGRFKPVGHNTAKPMKIHYSKERTAKERTVKSDRFFPNGVNNMNSGITFFRSRAPRPAPPAAPVVRPPPKRGRSASPQRRSPSPIRDADAEPIEPIEPAKSQKTDNKYDFPREASSHRDRDYLEAEMSEAPRPTTKAQPPAMPRRTLATETKGYALPVGDTNCDILDLRAKEEARRLLEVEHVPSLRDQIEVILACPPELPANVPPLLFVRMVLAHFPVETLNALRSLSGHRITKSGYFWNEILGGDVSNSAALRELLHQRRVLLSSFIASRGTNATEEQRNEPLTLLSNATIPAFSKSGDLTSAFRVGRLSTDEKHHPTVTRVSSSFVDNIRRNPGRRSAVPSFDLFKIAFEEFTKGALRHFDWTNACIVGSAPLACMMPPPRDILLAFVSVRRKQRILNKLPLPGDITRLIVHYAALESKLRDSLSEWYHGRKSPWRHSDIDVFVMADSLDEGKRRLERAYLQIASALSREHIVVRTPNSLTIASDGMRNIQLLLGVGLSPVDFSLFCDLDATALAYTGSNVLALPRAVHAINTRSNFIAPSALNNGATRSRIAKYAHRGFDAIVFELCKHWPRCDMEMDLPAQRLLVDLRRRIGRGQSGGSSYGTPANPEVGYDDAHLPSGRPINEVIQFAQDHSLGVSAPSFVPMQLDELLADEYHIVGTPTKLRGVRFRLHDILSSHRADEFLLKCYQCNKRTPFDPQHPELSGLGLCSDCAALNTSKLSQWDNIKGTGKVAVVTGARVKIGYQICLRLLRSGFTVIAVTRFPNDAARRYSGEEDFVEWRDRLRIYGVDLRHLPSVHSFIEEVKRKYKRLDVLINNAAQTIRRPRAYYRPLVDFERNATAGLLPAAAEWRPLLANSSPLITLAPEETSSLAGALTVASAGGFLEVAAPNNAMIPAYAAKAPLSAALTQVPLLPCDEPEVDEKNFPRDKFDEHGEPVDLRDNTSWTARLGELSPIEALETQIINSTVPLMLMQSFLPLLTASRGAQPSFVVNVSSAEGQFDSSVKKEGTHVHTNMAKAALNMMVRTLAAEMQRQRVFISAVDTGWVTRMRPVVKSKWKKPTPAPLSDKDGAARVLDPIALGLLGLGAPTGVLLRNYQTVPW